MGAIEKETQVMADFLLEIGLEEIPARMIAGAEAKLGGFAVADEAINPSPSPAAVVDAQIESAAVGIASVLAGVRLLRGQFVERRHFSGPIFRSHFWAATGDTL